MRGTGSTHLGTDTRSHCRRECRTGRDGDSTRCLACDYVEILGDWETEQKVTDLVEDGETGR